MSEGQEPGGGGVVEFFSHLLKKWVRTPKPFSVIGHQPTEPSSDPPYPIATQGRHPQSAEQSTPVMAGKATAADKARAKLFQDFKDDATQ